MYCTAIIDVHSRKIVGWGISNSLGAQHCVDVFEDAVRKHGKPEIINSDLGTQFTSHKWTSAVEHNDIKVSMDGKGGRPTTDGSSDSGGHSSISISISTPQMTGWSYTETSSFTLAITIPRKYTGPSMQYPVKSIKNQYGNNNKY